MFAVTFKQVALLLFYILIGYFLTYKKIIGKNASKLLSTLLMWVFSPFYTLLNLSQNVSVEKIKLYLTLLLSGIAFTLLAIVAALILAKLLCKKTYVRNVYTYLLAFSNNGYFGYPLVEALLGGEALAHFMIFCLATNIAIYTFGYYILTEDSDETVELDGTIEKPKRKKFAFLYNPPMIATYIGLLLGLLPIEIPQWISEFLTPAANCMSASAMLSVGCVLAGLPFIKLISSVKSYLLSIARLLVLPVIFGAIGYFCYKVCHMEREIFVFFTILSCLPAGMNAVVFPESVGKDGTEGAKGCFISYVMCLVTVPSIIAIMQLL